MSGVRYFVSCGKGRPVETRARTLAGAKLAAKRRREDADSDLFVWKPDESGRLRKVAVESVNMQKRGWPREWHPIREE